MAAALFLSSRPWFALVNVVVEALRRVRKVDIVVLGEGVEDVLPDAFLGAPPASWIAEVSDTEPRSPEPRCRRLGSALNRRS